MIESEIAIVGGGLAGLYAAYLLHKAGADFVLVEARERFGGRILTVDETGAPADDGFDLGPSWYWPQMQPAIRALVEELGLPAFAQNGDGDVIFERMSREGPQRYSPLVQEAQSMRLNGGSAAIVRALIAALPRNRLVTGVRVTAMVLKDDGVELTLDRKEAPETLRATQVVAAMPPRLLGATVAFTPALPEGTAARWRETPTWMAPHAKFFAIYDRPVWREAGLSGSAQSMGGPMPEMHDATTASGQAALFGFLGVGADQRFAAGEEALTRACLDQFARIFGPEAKSPRATLIKDWAADALTATPADRSAGGHPEARNGDWVTGSWAGYLSLSGSETSPSEPGYLAGAVTAGRIASETVLARLGLRP